MVYSEKELKEIFEAHHDSCMTDMNETGVDNALKVVSHTMHKLHKMGVEAKIDLYGGGSPAAFTMHNKVVKLHGYLTIGKSKHLIAFCRYNENENEKPLTIKLSKYDVNTGFEYSKWGVDVLCEEKNLFAMDNEDDVKRLQKWMVETAAHDRIIKEHDVTRSFDGMNNEYKKMSFRTVKQDRIILKK